MTKAIVLGAGMVGSIIAADLSEDAGFEVSVADCNEAALAKARSHAQGKIETIREDLSDPANVARMIEPYDIVLGALSSTIGLQTLRAVVGAGKNYCDISFMPESALQIDALAKERGVTAVVDCGVAPGMSNLLAGHSSRMLDVCENIEIYVGGLPREPRWPFNYKAAFSPYDVVEEYTRPSRLVENGEIVTREALSEPELMEFGDAGTLEAFNTDGLRSLADTFDVPNMKEKTLRYPGHIELMRVFRETGLFSHQPIDAGGTSVRPIDVISSLLFPKWTYEENEADLTVMRIIVEGKKGGQATRHQWDLLDYFDPETRRTSMARTTAYPCAIIARMIADGRLDQPGVNPPELIAHHDGLVEYVLDEHAKRSVQYIAS